MDRFVDRADAGRQLAEKLQDYNAQVGVVVALPRGGVVVGDVVAKALGWPMEVLVVRKIGAPSSPEYGVGAIAEGGVRIGKQDEKEEEELRRRVKMYKRGRGLPDLENKVVMIVDDGLATGMTMRAAIMAVNKLRPGKIIVAVPVASKETIEELGEVVCVKEVEYFDGVGAYYENFEQVTDEEVVAIMRKHE